MRRLGLLTGGGDCPGLNAVIRAITKTAIRTQGFEVIGIHDGFRGLLEESWEPLDYDRASGILSRGGTILGTSNHDNPFRVPVGEGFEDRSGRALATLEHLNLDVLVCIGGDGTMNMAQRFSELGVPIVGVPKTIDNDLAATDRTFGFDSAVSIVAGALDNLHSTAQSHHRVILVETMGRYAGWLALAGGVAGGADVILIPEIPYRIGAILDVLDKRRLAGRRFSLLAVAEGAKPEGGEFTVAAEDRTRTDPLRLGGVAQKVADQIHNAGGPDCRTVVLGHLQRGGSPTAFDRLLGTHFGVKAVELAAAGRFGEMAALRGAEIVSVPIREAVSRLKTVPPDDPLLAAARSVATSFGE